jgi:hypothetical protein
VHPRDRRHSGEAETAIGRVLDRLPGLALASAASPRGLVFRKPPVVRAVWEIGRSD